MPPAHIQWHEPQVHDGEDSGLPRITMASSNRNTNGSSSRLNSSSSNDVVRRSVSKSNIPSLTMMQREVTLSSGSDDSSSPSPPRRWQANNTTRRRRKRGRNNTLVYGCTLCSFRTMNAAIWLLALLAMFHYGTWNASNNGSHPLEVDQGPTAPFNLKGNHQLSFSPANMTTAAYLDDRSNRRLRAESNPILVEDLKQDINGEHIVHVIHTRFMQNQPNLLNLGLARLELFKEFTLRSMGLQSSDNFLWVIRTDPALNTSLREPLIEALSGIDNHLLIASNENPNVQIHDIITVEPEQVWSGDLERAKVYLQSQSATQKILESRLDADDALHLNFVEYLQEHALAELPEEMSQWKIWCASLHMEWQYHSVTNDFDTTTGILLSLKDSTCVSAGLTIGYTDGLQVHDLPPIKHEKLARSLPSCTTQDLSCLDFISLFPTALRARTPTSAGMFNVLLGRKERVDGRYIKGAKKQETVQNQLWAVTTPRFGFEKEHASRLRVYVKEHLRSIAEDNLHGQCSTGHSCKESSKLLLQAIIDDPEAYA